MKKYIFRQGFVEFNNTYIDPYDITAFINHVNAEDEFNGYAHKIALLRAVIVSNCTNLILDEFDKYVELDKKGVVDRILKKIKNADFAIEAYERFYVDNLFNKVELAVDSFVEQFSSIDIDKQKEDLENALQELQEVKKEHEAIMHG